MNSSMRLTANWHGLQLSAHHSVQHQVLWDCVPRWCTVKAWDWEVPLTYFECHGWWILFEVASRPTGITIHFWYIRQKNLEYREPNWCNGTALDLLAGDPGSILHTAKFFLHHRLINATCSVKLVKYCVCMYFFSIQCTLYVFSRFSRSISVRCLWLIVGIVGQGR